jgi:hypothetical protein
MVSLKSNAYEQAWGKASLYIELAKAFGGMQSGDPGQATQARDRAIELVRRYADSRVDKDTPDQLIRAAASGLLQASYKEAERFLEENLGDIAKHAPAKALEKVVLDLSPVIGYKGRDKLTAAHRAYINSKQTLAELNTGERTANNNDLVNSIYFNEKSAALKKLYAKMFANIDPKEVASVHAGVMHGLMRSDLKEPDWTTQLSRARQTIRKQLGDAKTKFEDEIKDNGFDRTYAASALAHTIRQRIRHGIMSGDPEKKQEAISWALQTLVSLNGNN